jgi:hypothetical protein
MTKTLCEGTVENYIPKPSPPPDRPYKHFTKVNVRKLKLMFCTETAYKTHMNNLYQTRKGIHKLMEDRPEMAETVKPMFDTLNYLVDALLPAHPSTFPYPPYNMTPFDPNYEFG